MRWTTHASAIADRYRAAVRGRAVGSVLAVERSVAVRAESKQLAKQLVAWPPLAKAPDHGVGRPLTTARSSLPLLSGSRASPGSSSFVRLLFDFSI
jgi:hypothetical protein